MGTGRREGDREGEGRGKGERGAGEPETIAARYITWKRGD